MLIIKFSENYIDLIFFFFVNNSHLNEPLKTFEADIVVKINVFIDLQKYFSCSLKFDQNVFTTIYPHWLQKFQPKNPINLQK